MVGLNQMAQKKRKPNSFNMEPKYLNITNNIFMFLTVSFPCKKCYACIVIIHLPKPHSQQRFAKKRFLLKGFVLTIDNNGISYQ